MIILVPENLAKLYLFLSFYKATENKFSKNISLHEILYRKVEKGKQKIFLSRFEKLKTT